MAEEAFKDDLEKSEEPTPKRREDARKQGQFPKSRNLIPAVTLAAIAIALKLGGAELMERLARCVTGFLVAAGTTKQLGSQDMMALSFEAGLLFAPVLLPIFASIMITGLGSGFLQTGFVLASEPLRFDLKRISPVAGFRRLFSVDSVAESIKSVLFIGGLGCIGGGVSLRRTAGASVSVHAGSGRHRSPTRAGTAPCSAPGSSPSWSR